MEERVLIFDMDGTIVDLYGVPNWLTEIRSESVAPYLKAKPIYPMGILNELVNKLKEYGWRVVVTSWTSMGGSPNYNKEVRKAKLEWLDTYSFPYDEVHIVKYGTPKTNCTKKLGGYQILFDDNAEIRAKWNLGQAVGELDMVATLYKLIRKEISNKNIK